MKEAESNEQFFYGPVQSNKGTTEDDDDENFADANETPKQVPSPQQKQTPPPQQKQTTPPPPKQTPVVPPPATTNKV
jgi:hypothetical protein